MPAVTPLSIASALIGLALQGLPTLPSLPALPEPPGETGTVVWTYRSTAPLFGPVAARENRIAALTRPGRLFVLASGRQQPIWAVDLGRPATAPPLWAGNRVLAGFGDTVGAWDGDTGASLWRRDLGGAITAPLALGNGATVWVPVAPDRIVALSTTDGGVLREVVLTGPPATATVVCGEHFVVGTTDGRLIGFSAAASTPAWERRCGAAAPSTPVCEGDTILAGCDNALLRLGLSHGRVKWRFRTGARVAARPLVLDRFIVFGSFDNLLYLLRRRNGHLVRTVPASHRVQTDPIRLGVQLVVLPETADALQLFQLPGIDPAGRLPLPEDAAHGCAGPVEVGPGLVAVGCGENRGALHLIRIGAPGKPEFDEPTFPAGG